MSNDRYTETSYAGWVYAGYHDASEDDAYGWLAHTGEIIVPENAPSWVRESLETTSSEPVEYYEAEGAIRNTIALKLMWKDLEEDKSLVQYMNIGPDEAVGLAHHLLRCAAACRRARGS